MRPQLTAFHKENMLKHIQYLRTNANAIRDFFSMDDFMASDVNGFPECGTSACSLGYAPLSTRIPCLEDLYDYSTKVFGIPMFNGSGDVNDTWQYLFNGQWVDVNNTPEAAAARMEAVLYNQIPDDWDYKPEFSHPIVAVPEVSLEQKEEAKALFVKL